MCPTWAQPERSYASLVRTLANLTLISTLTFDKDFDGTIFMQDTGHILFNAHGCGSERRAELEEQIKSGERSFRDVSEEMWGSLDVPFDDGFKALEKELVVDPGFKQFHAFCTNNNIPFNVISAGLKPVLRRVLDHFLGEEQSSGIDIVANEAEIDAEGHAWKPIWRHETSLGHDKALSIDEYKERAKLESDDGTIPMVSKHQAIQQSQHKLTILLPDRLHRRRHLRPRSSRPIRRPLRPPWSRTRRTLHQEQHRTHSLRQFR